MIILTIDTSTDSCVAVLDHNEQFFFEVSNEPRQHLKLILTMIDRLLKKAGITVADLQAIAYGCGPGSFTGVRIASSVAQGLAFAYQTPLIPVSSLAMIAQSVSAPEVLVALDAVQGHAYCGHYRRGSNDRVEAIKNEQLLPGEALKVFPSSAAVRVGKAWGEGALPIVWDPEAMARLARHYRVSGKSDLPFEMRVTYLAHE